MTRQSANRDLPAPVPVTIIGGFLGAGKTTLLNHILSSDHGIRAGVLVNDFGAVNIDAKLVVGVEGDDIVSLANGCVCCTIRDDLVEACIDLLKRTNPPEVLIVETSGVSDPFEVARTFDDPELQRLFVIGNLISVADAEQLPNLLGGDIAALARAQVQVADLVVLNKVDLVGADDLAEVRTQVRGIAPRSRILEASHARVPIELLIGTGISDPGARLRPAESDSPTDHSGHHSHHNGGNAFSTWHWTCDRPLSLTRLRGVIEGLPATVYRAKGIIHLEELPQYQIGFQMVGKRYNLKDRDPWGSAPPRTELVLIASEGGFDPDELQQAFEGCVGAGDETQSPVLRLSRRLARRDEPKQKEVDR